MQFQIRRQVTVVEPVKRSYYLLVPQQWYLQHLDARYYHFHLSGEVEVAEEAVLWISTSLHPPDRPSALRWTRAVECQPEQHHHFQC